MLEIARLTSFGFAGLGMILPIAIAACSGAPDEASTAPTAIAPRGEAVASGAAPAKITPARADPSKARATTQRPLEGRSYADARATITGMGWTPFPGACTGGGTSPETCTANPEIDSCSGVEDGFCSMRFARPGNCLTIVTKGGPPGPTGSGDTRVDGVQFQRRPCTSEPS